MTKEERLNLEELYKRVVQLEGETRLIKFRVHGVLGAIEENDSVWLCAAADRLIESLAFINQ